MKQRRFKGKDLKKRQVCEKDYICENGKYLESSIDDATFLCDENIEMTKTVPTKTIQTKSTLTETIPINFFKKKLTCKRENLSLLMIIIIYCCFIKHWSKQEQILSHYY